MFSLPKLLILALVIFAVYAFYKKADAKKKEAEQKRKEEEKAQKALEMKQDPICKSFVDEDTDHKVKLYNDVYYFCSEDCKNKFIDQHKNG